MNAHRLRDAEPDLIITQEVCGVYAVDATVVDEVLADLEVDPTVLALDASRLEDLFDCIRSVGRPVTGNEPANWSRNFVPGWR